MKPVEEALASAGFRRVILPGIVLTIGIHPIISNWIALVRGTYDIPATVLLIAEVIIFGLVISSALKWIYYVYEGFRLPGITAVAKRMNEGKLARLQKKFDQLSNDEEDERTKIYEYLCDFPIEPTTEGDGVRYVDRPTRIGNIIATYELYPKSRYGIDGIYYWQHLLHCAPESARKQFDDEYAFGQSLLLTSFSGAVVAILQISILIGFWIGSFLDRVILHMPTGPIVSLLLVIFGATTWLFFYRAALPAHRDAGDTFRAMVDAAMPKFIRWIKRAEAPLESSVIKRVEKLKNYLSDIQK